MQAAFTAVGQWSPDDCLIKIDAGWVPLIVNPAHMDKLLSLPEKSWIQVSGGLGVDIQDMAKYSSPQASIVVAQISDFVGDPKGHQHGWIEVDVQGWNFDFGERGVLVGKAAGGYDMVLEMPAIHTNWAKRNPSYLVGCRVHVAVRLEDGVPIGTRVLGWTKIADLRRMYARNLEASKPMEAWERQQGARSVRRVGRRSISPRKRKEVFMRDGFRCRHCGATPADGKAVFLEVDHIIPVARGGSSRVENLQTLCNACNAGKSDSMDPLQALRDAS